MIDGFDGAISGGDDFGFLRVFEADVERDELGIGAVDFGDDFGEEFARPWPALDGFYGGAVDIDVDDLGGGRFAEVLAVEGAAVVKPAFQRLEQAGLIADHDREGYGSSQQRVDEEQFAGGSRHEVLWRIVQVGGVVPNFASFESMGRRGITVGVKIEKAHRIWLIASILIVVVCAVWYGQEVRGARFEWRCFGRA